MPEQKIILLVEDDSSLRGMFRVALSLAGFDVIEAADGLDALHILDANPPDLVVLDLHLPRISGVVVAQEIAAGAHTRDIPVVIVTGSSLPIAENTAACILRKPVSPDHLVAVVRRCLRTVNGAGS